MTICATTPLVTNPVLIFFIVLAIILLSPILLNRFKIPHIIGLIVAGIVVGPFGFNVLADDSSFDIFGQVGLLYLMFLAGVEIDMYHLKLNLKRGLVFGVLTFLAPMIIGTLASYYLLKLDWVTSILLASMYASHTLISYPVVARLGLTKNPAVMIAIVGTIIAVIGSLLVLAAAVNIHKTGVFAPMDLLSLLGELAIYCVIIMYVYPRLTRWFFKNYSDRVTQFVYVMALVFLASWFAQIIGLEAVLGAFFAGLVLNRYIPNASPLMGRIEFVGNAVFIPYFLIGVGMMINIRVIGSYDTIKVALNMIVVAIVSKWIAAWIAQKIYRMKGDERKMLFGLSTAHTAVALAVVTIGYNMVMPDGHRMMDETILNGTVLMILVTCAIAPIVTSSAASRIKIKTIEEDSLVVDAPKQKVVNTLIPIANPVTAQSLIEIASFMRNATGQNNIFALHVRNDNSANSRALGRNSLEQAEKSAASIDAQITPIERYDMSTATGILNTIEERDINEVILGMHRRATVIDSFLGSKIDHILKSTNKMLIITRCFIPLNTVTRIVVFVPAKAQYETGFSRWVKKVANIAREVGCRIIFCCHPDTKPLIRGVLYKERFQIRNEFRDVEEWDDFLLLANRILDDDLFVVVSARRTSVSFTPEMDAMPGFLQKYFSRNNLIVLYPEQFGEEVSLTTFVDPLSADMNVAPSILWTRIHGWYRNIVHLKKKLTQRNRNKKIEL
ncbi:MAG: cation:proton antiporter [Muribaculaceae bacterium]|nr:cation:proton antiporter [Muribaculaceae bacterium]